ncbi:MAG TPA: sodium/substrate symporter small subunit, partial [Bacteroidales bacterium]|nr:sodium/substrate symporter small subunit [Bacteroidales bacterium]
SNMENSQNDYHINFFKPKTLRARNNRKLIVWLLAIWATAIFGFQIALKIIGKPTPEPALVEFNTVWADVKGGQATQEQYKVFARSVLQGLGKIYLEPEYISAMSNAFSYSMFKVAGEQDYSLIQGIEAFSEMQRVSANITNPDYIKARLHLESIVVDILGLHPNDPRIIAAPFSLKPELAVEFLPENQNLTEEALTLYMTHNRSILTDTKFLGFPFHYFFTAVFLLFLFVALCVIYCIKADKMEAKGLTV